MLNEIRIESLGAISVATAEFDRGLTVLTGETGTGKTMVVTGLHLLGGARADATRVRSGADRAVVEGRFTTTDLDDTVAAQLDGMLDASGAERDEDGSMIALRSVSRDGPSRAYLGGRSVPAKSLSGFTTELLTLHGQNDQLRLMRPEEQRGALDRFAAAGPACERYRKLRDAWMSARRDLVDRRNRARELAQEADRLQFALNEIDTVDPQPGEDDALVADIVRLSELDTLREAAATARAALSGELDDVSGGGAADSLGRARAALESTDDATLQALAEQIGEALTVVVDAGRELGDYLEELPVDASALESKLARQAQLRTLTRKYAADIDGVLRWAAESRERLAQLDVSEEGLAALQRRVDELAHELAQAAIDLSKVRHKAAKRLAKEVTAELSALAMADAEFTIAVTTDLVTGQDDPAALTPALGRAGPGRRGWHRPGRVRLRGASRYDGAAAGQERVRWRAVPGDAGLRGRAGGYPKTSGGHHDGVRRGRRRRRRLGGGADRAAAGAAGPHPPGHRGHAFAAGRGLRRCASGGAQHRTRRCQWGAAPDR